MRLRGHHLICIQGFRGKGYSKSYVDHMSRLVEQLRSSPDLEVEVADEHDDICMACPFLGENGCQQEGPISEERAHRRDRAYLEKLRLEPGMALAWSGIMAKLKVLIGIDDLEAFCAECEWLPLGYCREGVARLKG